MTGITIPGNDGTQIFLCNPAHAHDRLNSIRVYRIYNKMLNCDWFSARVFAIYTQLERNHLGVQLQLFNFNLL